MINNRQAGRRNRGRNNNGGGRPNSNNRGGGDNGNRIDSRSRGNATQLLEKYKNMARDAQTAGDRVNMEYYLQFADHYFRVLADNRARQEEQQQRYRRPGETFEDEGEDFEGVEDGVDEFRTGNSFDRAPREQARDQDQDRQQDRQDRRPAQDNREPREARDNQHREGQRQDNQGRDGQGRDGQPRDNRPRGDRNYRQDRPERAERAERASFEPVPGDENSVRPQVTEAPVQEEAVAEAPRRGRGRPRKAEAVEAPQGLDAALLPPSIARADNDSGDDTPPRRTRRPRAAAAE
ncbi:MAG: DUF4167 domain-containing protein [Sphingobium sp.]